MTNNKTKGISDNSTNTNDQYMPTYYDEGFIIVRVLFSDNKSYPWEYRVLDHGGCAFLIQNGGMGFDYWLDYYCVFKKPGVYKISEIFCEYYRDNGFDSDDSESWRYGSIAPVTNSFEIP
jgi:phosphatidylserine/phosphatidylglycerophosphate/cardiolipin synthase-like enzyme